MCQNGLTLSKRGLDPKKTEEANRANFSVKWAANPNSMVSRFLLGRLPNSRSR